MWFDEADCQDSDNKNNIDFFPPKVLDYPKLKLYKSQNS